MKNEQYSAMRLYAPGQRGKNPYWNAVGMIDGLKREISLKSDDLETAKRNLDQILINVAVCAHPRNRYVIRDTSRFPPWLRKRWHAAKERATKAAVPFSLTQEDAMILAKRASGRCEVTGLPFSDERPNECSRAPMAPSIDRISPALGYVPENCRLVAFAVNVAISDWGEETFRRIARSLG
jgi:hypothetical protein